MSSQEDIRASDALLTVENLDVWYGPNQVVHRVGFELKRGQSLALIGESGSGKSTISKAILGLLPEGSGYARGAVRFQGSDLLSLQERQLRERRGTKLGYIPQDPGSALNPVRSIGSQAHEAAALTGISDHGAQREKILEVFEQVGLPEPQRVYNAYPHQLSGGMLQRVLIALTVLPKPDLIVADEPTSALDVTVQKTILDLLDRLRLELGISLLLVTHDLAIAAERTERIVVLRSGKIQEAGSSEQIFGQPDSEYTLGLLEDVPALNPERYRNRRGPLDPVPAGLEPEISVSQVARHFNTPAGVTKAVDNVSFDVVRGSTHALVGESGSGKTTTVRMLLGLEKPEAGTIKVAGQEIAGRSAKAWWQARRQLQLVYQNPFTSLDPSWSIERIVGEPLTRYKIGNRAARTARVREALSEVGLDRTYLKRQAGQLSGGQRQRVAIARALAIRPELLVLDEPTSALDVSVQADILDLLATLQRDHSLTYLFVSHDLALVRQVADTVSVMRQGRVVESGRTQDIFDSPQHPYTQDLLDAVPRPTNRDSADFRNASDRSSKIYEEVRA